MRGVALFKIMECLPILRVLETARSFFATPRVSLFSRNAWLTKVTELSVRDRPNAPNISRKYSGRGVGREQMGIPMMAAAIALLFGSVRGLTPKKPGPQMQIPASFPISIEPT